MKAAPFEFAQASSLDEVLGHLAEAGDEAQIIAGGQSLVPMMAARLARPTLLVDINEVAELSGIERQGDGLKIKACTRQRFAERDDSARTACPLLIKALAHVGHAQTRNRGTVGGSMAHADPAAEIPLVAVTLDAQVALRSVQSERRVGAATFLTGAMTTDRDDKECLTELVLPIWRDGAVGTAFVEVSMRQGDFALLAVAAQVALDAEGRCSRAAVGIAGASDRAIRLDPVAEALIGRPLGDDAIDAAAQLSEALISPGDDLHASAGYRRRLTPKLIARALREAAAEARAAA